MIVQCQQCGTKYRLPRERVPESGVKARCKGCGHVMKISSAEEPEEPREFSEPEEPEAHIPTTTEAAPEEAWKCACGTMNEADESYCVKCKRSKLLFTSIPREPLAADPADRPSLQAEARRSSSLATWRSFLIVAALAVVLGVGISYALGSAVNRSITNFLTTIFK